MLAARWPKLERFELWDLGGEVELEPLLHVLSTVPLTHLALPFTDQLEALLQSPVLKRLEVLDLHDAVLQGPTLEWLTTHLDAFRHLERLDLTGAVDAHEEETLSKLGAFIVLRPLEDTRPIEEVASREPWNEDDELEKLNEPEALEDEGDPPAPNADLDIPDEHGD